MIFTIVGDIKFLAAAQLGKGNTENNVHSVVGTIYFTYKKIKLAYELVNSAYSST